MLSPSGEGSKGTVATLIDLAPLPLLVLGSVAGGATMASLSAGVSLLTRLIPALAVGLLLGIGGLGILGVLLPKVRRLLPERSCQVPRSAITKYGARVASIRWGYQLGLGFQSHYVTPAIYVLLAISVASTSLERAALPWLVYGFARGAAIAVAALWIGASPTTDRLASLHIQSSTRSLLLVLCFSSLLAALSQGV